VVSQVNFVRKIVDPKAGMNLDKGEDLVLNLSDETNGTAAAIGKVSSGRIHAPSHPIAAKSLLAVVVSLAEATTVVLTTFAVAFACHAAVPAQDGDIAAASVVTVLTFCLLHRVSRGRRSLTVSGYSQLLRRILHLMPILLGAALAGTLVVAVHGYARPQVLGTMSIWMLTSVAALLVVGSVGNYAVTHPSVTHRMARKVAVIGHDGSASRVADVFTRQMEEPFRLLGVFSDEPPRPGDVPVTGSVDELIEMSREAAIDDIVIALPPDRDAPETVAQLRWRLSSVAVEVYIMPHLAQREDVGLPVETFGPLALMVVQRRPLTHAQAISKRLMDQCLGLVLLVLLLPVLVAVAAAVKLDSPGPILFRQPRLGFNDRPFTVLKFRSMYANATDLMAARQTSRRDPRVTRVGKWLRKLSLDELPQLFNVLSGDMSLVGPRPHAPHTRAGGQLLKDAMAEYVIRHQVRPGITGWAQVNGARGELVTMDDLRRRVTYDLEYIEKWSLWFDLRIITMTILREVFSKHAF
jgi:Undecaprenyl-phosphate glucose phosphotransferase